MKPEAPPASPEPKVPPTLPTPTNYYNRRKPSVPPNTKVDLAILFLIGVVMPFEKELPSLAGFSVIFVLIFAIFFVNMLYHPTTMQKPLRHPLFVSGYFMALFCTLNELIHPDPEFKTLLRYLLMLLGGVTIAGMCRTPSALRACVMGILTSAVAISMSLTFGSYSTINSKVATTFKEVNQLRNTISDNSVLIANLNTLAFFASLGALIGMVMGLTAKTRTARVIYFAIAGFCFVATFLPISRSGAVIVMVAGVATLLVYSGRAKLYKIPFVMLGAVLLMIVAVPSTVFVRFGTGAFVAGERAEGRTRIYTAFFRNVPEFWITGVGAGNFENEWGREHGFVQNQQRADTTLGAHNAFFQLLLNWGLLGIAFACLMVFWVWRNVRVLPLAEMLPLCVCSLTIALFWRAMVAHGFYAKEYSLIYGMLVGSRIWIWQGNDLIRLHAEKRVSRQKHTLTPARLPRTAGATNISQKAKP